VLCCVTQERFVLDCTAVIYVQLRIVMGVIRSSTRFAQVRSFGREECPNPRPWVLHKVHLRE
jgi:hypothetical protein